MLMLSLPAVACLAVAGCVVDKLVGEPRAAHPLVAFGRLAARLERALNTGRRGRLAGLAAWLAAVAPPVALAAWLAAALPWPLAAALHVALLWFALGARSLAEHVAPIAAALLRRDLAAARALTARIVSRDTSAADEAALSRAAVESALENGNDAIFGALFWFAIAGGPGALLFRLANTLDAMWGYRTPRFARFGWAAARIDDALNWAPARLTAASYALLGDTASAWRCWRAQARHWDSPNAGPVMAAGAGSLNVVIGGPAVYHGAIEDRPVLGAGEPAAPVHVAAALSLVARTMILWLALLVAGAALSIATHHG
ncbi:adenosylcobinamide-phosphate synthase CbiB [Burkholderia pseudomallei]|uniref:adenosylcobinamide-phosphate synthase CbiB n=2 Tax=Burkholderia pseudomallei TaxID=28450 RepID=UPI0003C094AA|nr:adenosylcobinamide-phosphate synthase CbiB [Burkholderia pseudomallei]AGZ26922.1 cobD: cobalamin biosynthesis protein CobD [Burkholderia pseudomallei NCTC 13179]AHE34739.1 cobalamin biosynthesis protein CobD [Burkholderia pseudomallei NAU20B-16]AHG33926.1 cobalamin biosynthesis protein CobD [Burkholderia pseudomallei MSHR511]AHG66197.1 cobalamin biosynthesis protein CobD [Burkholderia pseudomallei MSHR146]AIV90446.1 cobalamin biosynthesis protein CobD [Burkholderia pseudomallei B03]